LGLRAKVDDRNETLGLKTRQIQMLKVPFMIVIGDKEMEGGMLPLRKYGDPKNLMSSMEEAIKLFQSLNEEKLPESWR